MTSDAPIRVVDMLARGLARALGGGAPRADEAPADTGGPTAWLAFNLLLRLNSTKDFES